MFFWYCEYGDQMIWEQIGEYIRSDAAMHEYVLNS
jgi:hypothetical protein